MHSFAQCLPNGGYKSTSILSVITQAQNNTVLAIAKFFSGYMFTNDSVMSLYLFIM